MIGKRKQWQWSKPKQKGLQYGPTWLLKSTVYLMKATELNNEKVWADGMQREESTHADTVPYYGTLPVPYQDVLRMRESWLTYSIRALTMSPIQTTKARITPHLRRNWYFFTASTVYHSIRTHVILVYQPLLHKYYSIQNNHDDTQLIGTTTNCT